MLLDTTAMYAMHDAVRREVEHLARVTVQIDADPRRILRTAIGWRLFKQAVRGHQAAEDKVLWPALRRRLADQPGELVVLEAMEAEHVAVDQLIATIDEMVTSPEACPANLGDLVDSLVTGLKGHLVHEEQAVLPLIQQAITTSEWADFERIQSELIETPLSVRNRWNPV
jgi:iron-sulfur cluster repair protein YtfE (RIC family)